MSLSFLISFMNFAYAQNTAKCEIIDKKSIYSFSGIGYEGEGIRKKNIFSELSIESTNTEGIFLKDNEIIMGKEGTYRIILSSVIKDNKTRDKYAVNINSKEAFELNPQDMLPTGVFFFQMYLKKGASLGFTMIKNNGKISSSVESNYLKVLFTDPKLIAYSEHH